MLSDLACRSAKPKTKPYKIFDSNGLYLEVRASGTKVWRLKYYFLGTEKLLTIGQYPAISLLQARSARDAAKELVAKGTDPSEKKQEDKKLARFNNALTFELIAIEWHTRNLDTWTPDYGKQILARLKANIFPEIGHLPFSKITPVRLLAAVQKIEDRKRYDLAKRALQTVGQIMRYAVVTGRAERDITSDLRGSLKKRKGGHYASITTDQLPDFLAALDSPDARLFKQTRLATRFMLLTFVRTKELIKSTWEEVDFKKRMWSIPGERMKMDRPHLVPLSKQAIEVLKELKEEFGDQGHIFPSVVKGKETISNNTILKVLKQIGYRKIMTGHGFRSLAMTTLKQELGYRHEVVDRQLAHLQKSKVDQAYDRAMFVSQRIKMMQEWADYIDKIRRSGKLPKRKENIEQLYP
ncbi:MAG TPA: integrase arm-type DNA-binding domain-containing protein [Puia sp.]|uniref:tyrosine-type recombinase/integrase n=1 Tax=Puia sp. TaxID=2045100 RepID=UPI002CA6C400|nr:integrase arm-type DNA-binding domain-containing protein [Puia sp.]HVU93733.1 integrase arm-type DNA-binding domain-containing protein [Puia sp.]